MTDRLTGDPGSGTVARLREVGVLAVVRAESPASAISACEALVGGGVEGIEITFTTPDAGRVLGELSSRYGERILLGAGTLLEPDQAREANDAGASFLVSPGFSEPVVSAMLATELTAIAGAFTASEVMRATEFGLDTIKLFPASLGGPPYLRALRGPFPKAAFLPTGGVAPANLAEWLAAGAIAVGAGSELCAASDIAAGRWDRIRDNAREFTAALGEARGAHASETGRER